MFSGKRFGGAALARFHHATVVGVCVCVCVGVGVGSWARGLVARRRVARRRVGKSPRCGRASSSRLSETRCLCGGTAAKRDGAALGDPADALFAAYRSATAISTTTGREVVVPRRRHERVDEAAGDSTERPRVKDDPGRLRPRRFSVTGMARSRSIAAT